MFSFNEATLLNEKKENFNTKKTEYKINIIVPMSLTKISVPYTEEFW